MCNNEANLLTNLNLGAEGRTVFFGSQNVNYEIEKMKTKELSNILDTFLIRKDFKG